MIHCYTCKMLIQSSRWVKIFNRCSLVQIFLAVVVAQLAERLLPLADICSLNEVFSKFYNEHLLLLSVEMTKIKKKEAGYGRRSSGMARKSHVQQVGRWV